MASRSSSVRGIATEFGAQGLEFAEPTGGNRGRRVGWRSARSAKGLLIHLAFDTRPHRYGGIFLGWLANAASHPAAPGPFSTLFYLPNRSASRAPAPKSSPTARSQKSRRGAQT